MTKPVPVHTYGVSRVRVRSCTSIIILNSILREKPIIFCPGHLPYESTVSFMPDGIHRFLVRSTSRRRGEAQCRRNEGRLCPVSRVSKVWYQRQQACVHAQIVPLAALLQTLPSAPTSAWTTAGSLRRVTTFHPSARRGSESERQHKMLKVYTPLLLLALSCGGRPIAVLLRSTVLRNPPSPAPPQPPAF